MAEEQISKKRRLRKAPETMRQRTEKAIESTGKSKRIRQTATTATKPLRAAGRLGKKEYYLPLPDSRVGRFLNKRRYFIPRYFRESWAEVRQVTWPSRRETLKLTLAVFLFASIFGVLVALVDYGLDKLFRRLLLS